MNFKRLNLTWGAEPNSPDPKINIDKYLNKLQLRFYLNPYMYKNFNEEDIGIIEFDDCIMFRLGPTNDEGFYKGQCRYSNYEIDWGEFYLIEGSDWKNYFPEDRVIINEEMIDLSNLNHYLFYFRDETFECIAREHVLKIISSQSKKPITSPNTVFTLRGTSPLGLPEAFRRSGISQTTTARLSLRPSR